MEFEPMRRKIQMKKVAGFHSFERGDLVDTSFFCLCRKAFGIIEVQIDG